MKRHALVAGLTVISLAPALAGAQGVAIEHKAVGCIVVGKFPKMNACFAPASNVARSRVYFRPEGTPSWYYVDMKSEQPCFSGVLPKPGKKLVGKKIEYYVEAQDKSFNPARTSEYQPIVVGSAQECKKNIPVAPFLNNATVAVFPSLPAGFAAGGAALGTGAVLGIVGAGAAAAGTAVVVANNNNNTTTTTPVVVNTTTTVATTTTTTVAGPTTTTTLPKTGNHAPNASLKTIPDPPSGTSPLTVTFDMCASTDPDGDPLTYFFDFGDGSTTSGGCSASHTYTATSFRPGVSAKSTSYNFTGSAVDPFGASQSRTRAVIVDPPTPTTTTTTTTLATLPTCPLTFVPPPPVVSITNPVDGSCATGSSVPVDVTATDPFGVTSVVVKGIFTGVTAFGTPCSSMPPVIEDTQTATGTQPNYTATLNLTPPSTLGKCYQISAFAQGNCSPATGSATINFFLGTTTCSPYPNSREQRAALILVSDLGVEGGRMQVVVNGSALSYPGQGRAYVTAPAKDGENHVDAMLVEGKGKPGTWRFEFLSAHDVAAGSLRVVAGDVASMTATSITFRLSGTPGERIAFTFVRGH